MLTPPVSSPEKIELSDPFLEDATPTRVKNGIGLGKEFVINLQGFQFM
jgi:hypothetical protein